VLLISQQRSESVLAVPIFTSRPHAYNVFLDTVSGSSMLLAVIIYAHLR
jgi:hypothetical protein